MTNQATFNGGVFSEHLPGGKEGADLVLEGQSLRALTRSGKEITWNFRDCHIELGGASGKMVFCRSAFDGVTAFSEEKGFLEALEQAAGGLLSRQIETARAGTRARGRKSLHTGLVLLGVFLVLAAGVFYGVKLAARSAVDSLPISLDQQIGEAAAPLITAQGDEVEDPLLLAAIEGIVMRLEPHAALEGFTYDVHVVRSEQVNAFALPGGTIVVLTGLLKKATSPEQVAGVLAHEIAHVTLRHGLRRITRSAGMFLALRILLSDVEGVLGTVAGLANQATMLGHSRDQEREADAEGARMLHAAAIDPEGLAEFFQLLEEEYGKSPELTSWFSTHPEHDERVAAIRALVEDYGRTEYVPFEESWDVDWSAVRERAGSL